MGDSVPHRQCRTLVGSPRKHERACLETCKGPPLHPTLAQFPCPGSPALSRNFTSKVSGALGPTGWTEHSPPPEARLWKYFSSFLRAQGMASGSRTRSGDGGQELEAMAVGVWLVWGLRDFAQPGQSRGASCPRDQGCKVSVSFPRRSLPVPLRATSSSFLFVLLGLSPR